MKDKSMNLLCRKHLWLAAAMICLSAQTARADDLFDDSFFANPAPVDAVKPADAPATPAATDATAPAPAPAPVADAPAPAPAEISAPAPEASATGAAPVADVPAPADDMPSLDVPAPAADIPAPSLDMNIPAPASDFGAPNTMGGLSASPSEQVLGKVSSDIFREMAEMERENSSLALQLKREQLRSEIDALKTSNRQMLFDEIERREKMTQARLEWELAQDLKRQEALERKQRAEIRQKQIEAALKREEDRRIQKMKDEEAERLKKARAEEEAQKKQRAELKKKYDAASLVRVNNLKPIMMAAARPEKIKRTPSSRVSQKLTETGEDLLTKKRAGEALSLEPTTESGENADGKKLAEPASQLYAVSEIRGTSGSLIAKLISKKDKTTFFAKKETILPTGHRVIDIQKDYVLVQIGKTKEMIGFSATGLLSDSAEAARQEIEQENENVRDEPRPVRPRREESRRRQPALPKLAPVSQNKTSASGSFSGASLAR